MKKLCCGTLMFYLFLTCAPLANAGQDNTTIVSFSRHTFRGVTKEIGPQRIALKEYGIDLEIPLFSYAEDATPRGLDVAKNFAGRGLQDAASLAVKSLGEHNKFDGHWDEFRADLATERTFWTAIKIREGLNQHPAPIALTGCPTKPGKSIDIVSTRQAVMNCVPSSVSNSPALALFKRRSEQFLTGFRSAIGIKGTMPALPTPYYSDELPKEYGEVAKLASAIEMAAALGAPLPQLVEKADKTQLLKQGNAVLTAGLNMLGIRFFIKNPLLVSDNISVPALKYMALRPEGSHTAIVTHDDYISALLHSLGLISIESEPSELAVYPLETIVFAFSDMHVAVARLRLEVQEDGYIPGEFKISLLWKGTRGDWDNKVAEVNARARTWDINAQARSCLNALEICKAETLEVAY